jgi:hypothetical protein
MHVVEEVFMSRLVRIFAVLFLAGWFLLPRSAYACPS